MPLLSPWSASCRSYAAAIVELLDPSGRLFGQRIIAQGAAGDGIQQDLTKRLMQVQPPVQPLHAPLSPPPTLFLTLSRLLPDPFLTPGDNPILLLRGPIHRQAQMLLLFSQTA